MSAERDEFAFGNGTLFVAFPVPVPTNIAVCPECNGALEWQVTTTDEELRDISIDCENEPDIDSDEKDFHQFHQSDWQPVIDKVKAWIRKEHGA